MNMPSAREILAMDAEGVADFIAVARARHVLSRVIRELNTQMKSADQATRRAARAAIEHLGFPVYA